MASLITRSFSQRAYEERVPIGAAYVLCRSRGLTPQAAVQLAEEAGAEAHSRALSWDKFKGYGHFRNWLVVTARNWVRDYFRRRCTSQLFMDDLALQPTSEAEDRELELTQLWEYLDRLPPEDREVLRLTFLEGLTLDQAAAVLEPNATGTPNARRLRVWSRRNVALSRLRSYFGL